MFTPYGKQNCDNSSFRKRFIHITLISAFLIFLLTCLVYIPTLKNEFVWDDSTYVSENILIRSLSIHSLYKILISFHGSNWHPLTWLSLALDYFIWDLDPLGYHLTNIILHGFNVLLIFFLIIRLQMRARGSEEIPFSSITESSTLAGMLIVASTTALLFGLHPLHVESVAWVAERKDLLCAFFVLLSILSYLSYTSAVTRSHRLMWIVFCFLLFICALMSKPMAITLPLILLLLDIYPLKRISFSRMITVKDVSLLKEKIPFFTLSIVSSMITIMAQHAGGAIRNLERFSVSARLLNALRALIFYLEKMCVPLKLVPFYPFPTHTHWLDLQYLLPGILVLAITASCLWSAKQGKHLMFVVWSYYVITLLPVLGIIQVGGQAAADRYTYLPSLGIFTLIGVGCSWIFEKGALLKRKSVLAGWLLLLMFIFAFLGGLTMRQIKIWRNSETLWSYVISVFPKRVPFAHIGLGIAYLKKGMFDEAIREYKQSLVLKPRYAGAHNNLGNAYWRKGMLDEAISEYKEAISIKPNFTEAHNNLGAVYINKGMVNEAISELKEVLAIEPNFAEAHNNLGVAYYYKRNYKLSIFHCDNAVELGYRVDPRLLELLKPYR